MLKVWNVLLVILAFCLALFGTFLTRSGVVSSIHSFTQSPLGGWFLGFICLITIGSLALIISRPAAAALEDADGVARLARGDVPLQQPAARGALPDDPLGRHLPDPHRGRPRRADHGQRAVLQLLPADLRAPAAAADGDRPARRVAAGLPALARPELRVAGRDRARGRGRPAPARRGLVLDRRCSPTPSPRSCSARSATSSCAEPGRGTRSRAGRGSRLLGARRAQPAALRRLHRPRGDRPARDRRRRLERLRQGERADADRPARRWRSATTGSRIESSSSAQGANATEFRAHLDVRRAASRSARSSPERTTTAPSSRARTRSASAATT